MVDCLAKGFRGSPEGEQEFELGAGESVTVTGITGAVGAGRWV